MNDLDSLLKQLGQNLGIAELCIDSGGYCALSIDESWTLHMQWTEIRHGVQCMAELGRLPGQGRDLLLTELLGANALFAGTDGATLGLDPTREQILLCREIPLAGLDYITFEQALDSFIQQAVRWRSRIEQCPKPGIIESWDANHDCDPVAVPTAWLRA